MFVRLENTKENHNKFYEVSVKKESNIHYKVYCTWGKIGLKGRTQEKGSYDTRQSAVYWVNRIIDEKLAKGYVRVNTVEKSMPPKKKVTKKPTLKVAPEWDLL